MDMHLAFAQHFLQDPNYMHKISLVLLLDNIETRVNQPLLPILPLGLESPCVAMPWSCTFLINSKVETPYHDNDLILTPMISPQSG
jgi:hypothetical protein